MGVKKGPVSSDVAFVPVALGSLHDLGALLLSTFRRAPGRAPAGPGAPARAWCGTAHLSGTSLPFVATPGSAPGALQTLLRVRRFASLQYFKKANGAPDEGNQAGFVRNKTVLYLCDCSSSYGR